MAAQAPEFSAASDWSAFGDQPMQDSKSAPMTKAPELSAASDWSAFGDQSIQDPKNMPMAKAPLVGSKCSGSWADSSGGGEAGGNPNGSFQTLQAEGFESARTEVSVVGQLPRDSYADMPLRQGSSPSPLQQGSSGFGSYSVKDGSQQELISASYEELRRQQEGLISARVEAETEAARRAVAKKKNMQGTFILAAVFGAIILVIVFFTLGTGGSETPQLESPGCKQVQCDSFNTTDTTCGGALYSWCCSEVGGVAFCSFEEQRDLAWGAVIAACPACKDSCLLDKHFGTGEMYESLEVCGLA